MKRSLATTLLFGLLTLAALPMAACAPTPTAHAGEQPVNAVATPLITDAPPTPSCASPTPDMASTCDETARRILASTVRIEFHGPAGGIGHGTIVGGRYLITHNHYPVTAAALNNGGEGVVTAVSVLKANGDIILLKAPLSYFKVVREEPEMLLLDFQAYNGLGFFDSLGVPSVEWSALRPAPGTEVAQVNWDGTTAHVDWVRVTTVHLDRGAATIELDSFVEQGASGGGVFHNGVHIANNWTRQTDRLESGAVVRRYSMAALNPVNALAVADQ